MNLRSENVQSARGWRFYVQRGDRSQIIDREPCGIARGASGSGRPCRVPVEANLMEDTYVRSAKGHLLQVVLEVRYGFTGLGGVRWTVSNALL